MLRLPTSLLAAAAASVLVFTASPEARADDAPPSISVPHPYAYGILVGSNAGGPGQQTLRYAEDDAKKMADVLRQLGRYGQTDLQILAHPDGAKVLATVDDVAQKMKAHAAKGEQAILVFYYSGHAKANAFDLGAEELAIATLRDRLRQIPSTLTLVILDACQSGQFARVKGVEPAADFSFNSVSRIGQKGIAIMASSSAQELSQESDELKGSVFTHHLVTALRGAADADGDGRVSLDEAYRYAYRRTLATTAQTQVGSQHVTLETDLAGQGDVPVTYPADAKSQLELPGPLDGKVLVQHRASGNVVAEVQKSPGAPIRLAFVAGGYEAIVRTAGKIMDCKLTLADDRVTPIDLGGCSEVKKIGLAKGEGDPDMLLGEQRHVEPFAAFTSFGFTGHVDDAFVNRLREFGYIRGDGKFHGITLPRARFTLGASKGLLPHLVFGVYGTTLSGDTLTRSIESSDDTFTFDTYAAGAFVRAYTDAIPQRTARSSYLQVYGQLGGGLSMGVATLETGSTNGPDHERSTDRYFGYVIGGAAGLRFVTPTPFAFYLQGGYDYAPTVTNLVGDTHDSGGPHGELGVEFRFGH
jgi:hypothetical protein